MRRIALALLPLLALLAAAAPADAKKFKYASGPKAPEDTALSVAEVEIEPIVRTRGPRVPATNLQLTTLVANVAFERALARAPLDSGGRVTVAPSASHPYNFIVEHAVLRDLARRGVTATVRRTPAADSVAAASPGSEDDPVLEYHLATARVTYLRLIGWLPGRVRIERQSLVEGTLTLRDPRTSRVLWTGDASHNLLDSFPRSQLPLIEDERFKEFNSPAPQRNIDKVFEPIVVVAVVIGLVALFFQNRP